jgi:hypothetical protein
VQEDRLQDSGENRGFFSKHLKDIVVIIVLALIVYILVEQTVRVYLFGGDAFSYAKMSSLRSTGGSGNLKPSNIDGLVYELKPGVDTIFKLVAFNTNSRGLRDKEYSLEKPPGTYRVAVVGGSFTMGAGVEIEETFHSRLEERLNGEPGELNYEFINFGVAGYSIENKLIVLKHKILEYDPDLVLFVLDGSQFVDDKVRTFTPRTEKFSFFTSYSYKLIKKLKILPGRSKSALDFTRRHMRRLFILDHALFEIAKFSEENGIPVSIVVLDHDYQHNRLGEKIEKKVGNKNNLFFSNTLPVFRHKNFRDYSIYKVDMHPNSEANRIFAEVIYRDLINQSLLGKQETEAAENE